MSITVKNFDGSFDGKSCFVHARAGALDRNRLVMTLQKLDISGSDLFSDMYVMKSFDGGNTWTNPVQDTAFMLSDFGDGLSHVGCDATHIYHKKTGKLLTIGHLVHYNPGEKVPAVYTGANFFYIVYDEEKECYNPIKLMKFPENVDFGHCGPGCSQFVETENGDILVPVGIKRAGTEVFKSVSACAVLRCSFDGETLTYIDIGNELFFNDPRGICEPQICFYNGKYYLSLRSDSYGLYSVSSDGKSFSEPELWKWDTGEILPNYNTQQHWLISDGKLYLVYTRKAGNNDHVFRHRAPLFIAQVDTEKMCIMRHTEKIAVPERGARLGNFGVTEIDESTSLITVSEWMQPEGCEKYGSDNSIFITTVKNGLE